MYTMHVANAQHSAPPVHVLELPQESPVFNRTESVTFDGNNVALIHFIFDPQYLIAPLDTLVSTLVFFARGVGFLVF